METPRDRTGPEAIVAAAVSAASAHYTQPWAFAVSDQSIDLYADMTRTTGANDPLLREFYISLGCALENLHLVPAAPPPGNAGVLGILGGLAVLASLAIRRNTKWGSATLLVVGALAFAAITISTVVTAVTGILMLLIGFPSILGTPPTRRRVAPSPGRGGRSSMRLIAAAIKPPRHQPTQMTRELVTCGPVRATAMSVTSTKNVRSLRMRLVIWGGAAVALAGLVGFYIRVYRPRQLRWGATDEEVARPMPGDKIVPRPVFNATRAVTVNARPEDIWPWLVQIGFGRAGWYSYDILDNLGRHSSEQILPEYQHLEPGDLIPLGPGAESGLFVKDIRPNEWMVWWERKRQSTTWVWGLYPLDGEQTRLITRVRNDYRKGVSNFIFGLLLIEPADFPLMRKCMLGIKRRAEARAMHARAGSV